MLVLGRSVGSRPRRLVLVVALAATAMLPTIPVTASASGSAPATSLQRHPRQVATIAIELTATWSGTAIVVGNRATVHGTARPASSVRRVLLQRRTSDGWQNVRSKVPAKGGYAIGVPTGWYGRFGYRLRAVARPGSASRDGSTERIRVVPSYTPRGPARSHRLSASPPARWDPCEVIGYRVNAVEARSGALKDIGGALRRVHQATGLRFVHRGTTRKVPQSFVDTYPEDTQLVFAWAKPRDSPLLANRHNHPPAVGGATWDSRPHGGEPGSASQITSGHVLIDSTQEGRRPVGFGRGATRGELLMHAIGHAVGLRHVNDQRQVMHPRMQPRSARWGAGDLAGLAKLGASQGCLS